MNFDYVHNKFALNKLKLKKYGFSQSEGGYFLEKQLPVEGFVAKVKIDDKTFVIDIFDTEAQSDYFLTNVEQAEGSFVGGLKKQVFDLRDDIVSNCFSSFSVKEKVIDFMKSRFDSDAEFPWEDENIIFRVKSSTKWFALIMTIPAERLGLKSKELVDVLNLKHDPLDMQNLYDGKNIFPAYHMNKIHWLTILLDKNIDFAKIMKLVCESYDLVENKK